MSSGDPVVIATFWDVGQAEFALSVLEGSGISGHIEQPYTASIAPHHMIGAGGVRLWVSGEDEERALDVLAAVDRDQL